MVKTLWIGSILALLAVVAIPFTQGLKPKTKPVIKPSGVNSPEELGRTIYRQMRPRLKTEKRIVFGVDPNDNFQLSTLASFFNENQLDGKALDRVLSELDFDFGIAKINSIESPQKKGLSVVKSDQKVLHFGDSNWIKELEKSTGSDLISILFVNFQLGEKNSLSKENCEKVQKKNESVDCMVYSKESKPYRYKKIKESKFKVEMEQVSQFDYIVYLSK